MSEETINQGTIKVKIDRSAEVEKERAEKEQERKAKEDAQRKAEEAEKLRQALETENKKQEEEAKKLIEERDRLLKESQEAKAQADKLEKEKQEREKTDAELKKKQEEETKKKADEELAKAKDEFFDQAKAVIPAERLVAMKDSIKTINELNNVKVLFKEIDDSRKAYEEDQRKRQEDEKKKPPSGSVPLNPTAGGKPLEEQKKQGYTDYKEMTNDLRERELLGDPEAHQILNALFLKELEEVKEKHKSFAPPNVDPESLAEALNRRTRILAEKNYGRKE